jgi:hypothetical protein
MSPIDDAGGGEDVKRVIVTCDVQLVARRAIECATPVRSDLRAQSAVAQQCESPSSGRSAPEVEMQRPVPPGSEMKTPGRMEERGEFSSPIAGANRRDSCELFAYIFGSDHTTTPSSASNLRLTPMPETP